MNDVIEDTVETMEKPKRDNKRLYRPKRERVVAGVCAGLANYFGIDVVIMRIIAVVLLFTPGPGLLLYLIAWMVMPDESQI